MKSISDIKINLIKKITAISDYDRLVNLQTVITSELKAIPAASPSQQSVDKFELGSVNIRSGVAKDQIFKEQGKTAISFQEVQDILSDEPWDITIEELLATLN